MDSKQIHTILSNDTHVKDSNFLGVFPIDLIPLSAMKFPCCLVVNTQDSKREGLHWVAVMKTENRLGVYFDSFGYPPLPEIGELFDNCIDYQFNDTRLQSSLSTVCGQYVIFALTHLARGFTLENIVNLLHEGDQHASDAFIYNYIKKKYIDILPSINSLKIVDFPFVFNQISRSLQS